VDGDSLGRFLRWLPDAAKGGTFAAAHLGGTDVQPGKRRRTTVSIGLIAAVSNGVFIAPALTDHAGLAGEPTMAISRFTIDAGGDMLSTGGDFELSGTAGQPDAGVLSGGEFTLAGGFWFGQPPGDGNGDGGVNLADYAELHTCASGPGGEPVDPSCACFDLDADQDVDMEDVAAFQRLFSGS
jgi:hypothetical protein